MLCRGRLLLINAKLPGVSCPPRELTVRLIDRAMALFNGQNGYGYANELELLDNLSRHSRCNFNGLH
jgi:hypothetical protein